MWKVLVLATLCLTKTGICQPGVEWEFLWPDNPLNSFSIIDNMQPTPDGGLLLRGTGNGEGVESGIYLIKVSSFGEIEWLKRTEDSWPIHDLVLPDEGANNGILLIGYIYDGNRITGIRVTTLNYEGDSIRSVDYASEMSYSLIAQTISGNIVLIEKNGQNLVESFVISPAGDSLNTFETQTNSQMWGRQFLVKRTNRNPIFVSLSQVDQSIGITTFNITSDGEPIDETFNLIDYDGGDINKIIATSDGGFLLSGFGHEIIKMNADFELEWQRNYEYGQNGDDYFKTINAITELENTGFLISAACGTSDSPATLTLIRVDAIGRMIYAQDNDQMTIEGGFNAFITVADDGGYYHASTSYDTNEDGFLIGKRFWLFKTEPDVWGVDDPSPPLLPAETSFTLFPNPCNQQIGIKLQLTHAGLQTLNIFSSAGRLEREINLGFLPAGESTQVISDHSLCNGVYFIHLVNDIHSAPQPIVILK